MAPRGRCERAADLAAALRGGGLYVSGSADRGQEHGLQFADWLQHRFPDPRGRSAEQRVRASWRVRLPLAVVAGTAAWWLSGRVLDRHLQGSAPADTKPVLGWIAGAAMIGGYALLVVGLVRWWRAGRSEPSPYARSALQALTRRQGRELSAELRGSKPVPPEDVPVLRHLALIHVRGRHLTPAIAGMALFFAGGALVVGRAILLAVLAVVLVPAAAVYLAWRRSQAEAYLRRTQLPSE